jgi:hypothetical protein
VGRSVSCVDLSKDSFVSEMKMERCEGAGGWLRRFCKVRGVENKLVININQ